MGAKLSIHSEESIKFMTQEIGVGEWQEKLMVEGLQLEFSKEPGRYMEPNNKSAEQHMEVVREKVAKWVEQGYVEKLTSPAWCTNPLTVAAKYDAYKQEVKLRPCIDLSRHVNKHIKQQHVKLDGLDSAEQLIEQGDFLTSFDLENQFFHVFLRPEDRKYFGFAVPDDRGNMQYYQFAVMAYGFSPAVAIVTRLLQPVKAYLYKLGIKLTLYVDDGRIVAKTEKLAVEQLRMALLVLQLAGWNIQWAKTDLKATQRQLHLGYITDTVQMKYYFPEEKKVLFDQQLTSMLSRSRAGESIAAKEWASVLGRLQSMQRSHGKIVQIMSRACQHALGVAVSAGGWEAQVQPQQDCMREMTF
jgi:Reverse transcriptase (RNA-dependent DNA polymerase)